MTDPRIYRTFWPRVGASIIDILILVPLDLVDGWIQERSLPAVLVGAWFTLYSVSWLGYSIGLHAHNGQTIGKRITGVRVVDVSGGRLSLRQALLRDSVWVLVVGFEVVDGLMALSAGRSPYVLGPDEPALLYGIVMFGSAAWVLLEIVSMLFNAKRRAIHDFLAGSVVVRVRGVGLIATGSEAVA